MEVKINREIRNYTESMFFGLLLRQFIFLFLPAVLRQDCISIYTMNDGSMFSALTKYKSKEFWESQKYITLYDTGLNAEYGDNLITLSTCEYSRTNGRFVVVAKKISQ